MQTILFHVVQLPAMLWDIVGILLTARLLSLATLLPSFTAITGHLICGILTAAPLLLLWPDHRALLPSLALPLLYSLSNNICNL